MNIRLKRYKKEFEHSYTYGVFPTLELLTHQRANVLGVISHPKGVRNAGILKIQELCKNHDIPFEMQERSFARLGARKNDYAVGVFKKNQSVLDSSCNHVILVNPSGMGNLGTIIRTMIGFGFHDMAIIGTAVDNFHPDVIRASMGSIFQLRFQRFYHFSNYQESYPRNFYPLMTDGSVSLPDAKIKPTFGLIFGSESEGLPQEYHQYGRSIRIPQSKFIDSLNVAIAVGVTLYHTFTYN